jgi:hypothetical protein
LIPAYPRDLATRARCFGVSEPGAPSINKS